MDDSSILSKLGKIPKSGRIVASTVGILGAIALLGSNNRKEVFNHEEHDEIDELIEDLDKLTAFCIGFLHDGAYGGESLGREDLGDGMEEERVRYVEGSIELKFVYEDGEIILIRASYTNEDDGPVIYLPPPKFIRDKPEDERTRLEAEYTPSQSLRDYTPEQLATSSTITGDFTQDAVKYSNTRYASEEIKVRQSKKKSFLDDGTLDYIIEEDGQCWNCGEFVKEYKNYWDEKYQEFSGVTLDDCPECGNANNRVYVTYKKVSDYGADWSDTQAWFPHNRNMDKALDEYFGIGHGGSGSGFGGRDLTYYLSDNQLKDFLPKLRFICLTPPNGYIISSSIWKMSEDDEETLLGEFNDDFIQKIWLKELNRGEITQEKYDDYMGGIIYTLDMDEDFQKEWASESDEATLKKYEKTYGKEGAKVRLRLKKKIMKQNTHGTKSGQWSARKSQKLNKEYEAAMEKKGKKAYKSSKRTSAQKDLKKWGDQKWRTKSGKKSSVTGERYLPDKAIKALTDKEYKKTTAAKRKAKKAGKQFSKQPKAIAKKVAKYRAEYKIGTQGPCWDGYTYVGPKPLAKGSCRRD